MKERKGEERRGEPPVTPSSSLRLPDMISVRSEEIRYDVNQTGSRRQPGGWLWLGIVVTVYTSLSANKMGGPGPTC